MDFTKINWNAFLVTEKANIKKALNKGDYKSLVVLIEEMNPEKEIEIQKIVNVFRSESGDFDSEVRKSMETEFHSKPIHDITPEEEAEWQKKIDEEKEKVKNSHLKKNEIKELVIDGIDEDGLVDSTAEEIKDAAEEKLEIPDITDDQVDEVKEDKKSKKNNKK